MVTWYFNLKDSIKFFTFDHHPKICAPNSSIVQGMLLVWSIMIMLYTNSYVVIDMLKRPLQQTAQVNNTTDVHTQIHSVSLKCSLNHLIRALTREYGKENRGRYNHSNQHRTSARWTYRRPSYLNCSWTLKSHVRL